MKVRVDKSRGIGTGPRCRGFCKNQTNRVLKVIQGDNVKKTKLIRVLGQFSSQRNNLTMTMKETQSQKVIV